MTPDWTPLDTELRRWADAGLTLPLWWRDDDAIADTPPLHRLADLADRLDMPVHLAVIPAGADDTLNRTLEARERLLPVFHGWTHRNHAPEGQKKAEFGAHRPVDTMLGDIDRGRDRLVTMFGADRLRGLFVPPWNRIAPDLIPRLPEAGLAALSTFTPRRDVQAARGVLQINTHLDPIDWRGTRSLADPDRLIAQVARQLADRRLDMADTDEPYGILTHHLVHDAAIWDFTESLLTRLLRIPVRRWTAPPLTKGPTQ